MYVVVGLNGKAKELVSGLKPHAGKKYFDGNQQEQRLRVFLDANQEVIFEEIVQQADSKNIYLTLRNPDGQTPPEALWQVR